MDKVIKICGSNVGKTGIVGVVDENGDWYSLSKKANLTAPPKGTTCLINYIENDWNGKPSRWIQKIQPVPQKESAVVTEKHPSVTTNPPTSANVVPESKDSGIGTQELIVRQNSMSNAVHLAVAYMNLLVSTKQAEKYTDDEVIGFVNQRRKEWYESFVKEVLSVESPGQEF